MVGGKSTKAMSKSTMISYLADKLDLQKKVVNVFFDEFTKLAYKEAKNSFTIPGIGKLVLVHRKARKGRNPATGEVIDIPAKNVVKFRISKLAKDAILKK